MAEACGACGRKATLAQRHHVVGAGLVRSVDNFGQLDWLASEFVAQGWTMQAMLRLMFLHGGRHHRLTDVRGHVIREILA